MRSILRGSSERLGTLLLLVALALFLLSAIRAAYHTTLFAESLLRIQVGAYR